MTIKDQSYYVAGGRTGVLLMHGLCGTPTEMRFVANGLARAGFTVYCPQLAGHGGSEADIKESTWQDWYASAEEALARLRKECDVVIVGGLSTGAVLALLLAARHPEDVHGTALLAPTFWLNGWLIPWYARLFKHHFQQAHRQPDRLPGPAPARHQGRAHPRLHPQCPVQRRRLRGRPAEHPRRRRSRAPPAGQRRARRDRQHPPAGPDHPPARGRLRRPRQRLVLAAQSQGLVDMVVLDDSYHIVTVDRQRHLVVERVSAYVANVAKSVQAVSAKARDRGDAGLRGRLSRSQKKKSEIPPRVPRGTAATGHFRHDPPTERHPNPKGQLP